MIILSNNLWNRDLNSPAWAAKGEDCSADARVDGLISSYMEIVPDVIGFQEMSRHMEKLVMDRMKEYALSDGSIARYEIATGGYTPLLFRYDKYRLLESVHRIYDSAFPPYEDSFNDADSKGFTCGVLEDRTSGNRIIIATTHLWWKSDDPANRHYQRGSGLARASQILSVTRAVDDLVVKYNCPAILMGDLNDELESPALNTALISGWLETHALCVGERNDTRGYHYCYPDGWRHDPPGEYIHAIDHILIKNPGNSIIRRFDRYMKPRFERLSDHFPVYIELEYPR